MNIRKQTAINVFSAKKVENKWRRRRNTVDEVEDEEAEKGDGKISNENDRNACMYQTWQWVSHARVYVRTCGGKGR